MVVVPKPNGALRICLDPKDLNRALQRENYPLPTIEEVAPRLHGAKGFTVLHLACGFWHVALDEQPPFLTTLNTPFGRYRWERMHFGIKYAPEIFLKMHELIEGRNGVEVIADGFIVVGYGIHCKQHLRITTRVFQRSFRDVKSVGCRTARS